MPCYCVTSVPAVTGSSCLWMYERVSMPGRPLSLSIVATLMILFGLAEVVTGFTHHFFGLSTSETWVFTYSGAAIGLFYILAGVLTLTMRRKAGIAAIILLCADVAGRLVLVATGLYPFHPFKQAFAIVAGTAIAAGFAIYIGFKLRTFAGSNPAPR